MSNTWTRALEALEHEEEVVRVAAIMVADDDPDILDLVCLALKGAGHETSGAHHGGDALSLALSGGFELLVLDVMMPVHTGLEVVHEVRSHLELAQPAILMLSALASQTDVQAGREVGADDYLAKPFSLAELVRRVAALLDQRDAS